ncbi:hypothetical protein GT037_004857 [Alternaria burnsii]|uniref:Heterokaryon incompatibility domain-containing protein n=1 Tax=Alternaria burnsii TaxID=1187904 RepID=A0A8H7EG80_9PLEO|nr:uncharacterized protein GT037_004857 [Alternaria burnsii]KAF7676645.1 hypothetical protein GT037_004857 [Alternaria burnsii]
MAIRLIDTENLMFKSFVGSSVPEYAILSHTWGPEADEVTFQDMLALSRGSEHPKRHRLGYRKIIETCQEARSAGIGYCWVDTCCIDKTSSAELSEAINSMFKWYHDAVICYVLLSDLDIGDIRDLSLIRKCRWFKRGWCLQELVAPRHVEFYDCSWNFLGSKDDLSSQISNITAIATHVLTGQVPLETLPVAQRLAWAAKRETTRTEDIAYCLLGIFGIQLPILYGEGTKAFIRLQEEIMKQSNDRSIFASQQPCGNEWYCSLLAPSPEYFTHSYNLVHWGDTVYQGSAYALTNRGLQFSETKLYIDYRSGLYLLPLNCILSRDAEIVEGLLLQQVGPDLFARRTQRPDFRIVNQIMLNSSKVPSVVKKGIYIISQLSASIQADLRLADLYAIQLSSDTLRLGAGYEIVQVVEGSTNNNRWDVARMRFLTRGCSSFEACWKLYPSRDSRLKNLPAGFTLDPCYVLCAFTKGGSVKGMYLSPRVAVLSQAEWLDLERKNGTFKEIPDLVIGDWHEAPTLLPLEFRAGLSNNLYLHVSHDLDTKQKLHRLKINFGQH